MDEKIEKFTSQMEKRPGASMSALQKVEAELEFKFPKQYANFLLESNGAEGAIGRAYLVLWPLEKIKPLNQMNEMDKHAPYLVLFGSDGGAMAFAFDKRSDTLPIMEIEYMEIGLEEPKTRGQNFIEFLEYMFNKWKDVP
jgi:hypothetical protein